MATKRGADRRRSGPPSRRRRAPDPLEEPFEDAEDLDLEDLPEGELADLVIATFDAVVPKPIRRALATGIGAAMLTEESVRKTVENLRGDPREIAEALASQAERARDGVRTASTKEILGLLKRVENARDLRKLLHGVTLELTMQVRFSSDDEEAPPARSGLRARIRRKPRA